MDDRTASEIDLTSDEMSEESMGLPSQSDGAETSKGVRGNKTNTAKDGPRPRKYPMKRKSRKRSKVWIDFTPFNDENGNPRAFCIHCKKSYAAHASRNGTTAMKNHLLKCGLYPPNVKKALSHTLDSFLHSTGNKEGVGDSRELGHQWKLDLVAVRRALIEMIIMDELPFAFVEHEGFKKFMQVVCPQFVIPSRTTTTKECLQLYEDEQHRLRTHFENTRQMVCLTTDMWTSNQNISYLCLTAHFIDDGWRLCKRILNFVPCPNHKGDEVGLLIHTLLNDWGVKRIFTCTVDNAYANDKTMEFLAGRYGQRGHTPLRGKVFHMRCVAHIINLAVRDGVAEVGTSVERIRMVVKYVRQSPNRLGKFKTYAKEEGITSTKMLCMDVSTRWNSTYYMLETAIIYQHAFDRYAIMDPQFKAKFTSAGPYGTVGLPTSEDWTNAIKLVEVLQHFESLTRRVSGTAYVTSNMFLDEVSDIYGLIRDMTEDDSDLDLCLMADRMKKKFDKYWGKPEEMNMLLFIPTFLDPRKKRAYGEIRLVDMYGSLMGKKVANLCSDTLYDLFKEYKNHYAPSPPPMSEGHTGGNGVSSCSGSGTDPAMTKSEQLQQVRREKAAEALENLEHMGVGEKTELELYMTEGRLKLIASVNDRFDILGWWKINAPRFPILSKLARDIFALPISTVSSESVFSTSRRIISDFRSSLTPYSAQALICAQNWLRETPIASIEETLDALTIVEDGRGR